MIYNADVSTQYECIFGWNIYLKKKSYYSVKMNTTTPLGELTRLDLTKCRINHLICNSDWNYNYTIRFWKYMQVQNTIAEGSKNEEMINKW